jgi:serine/threonine-protein kinase
VIVLSPSATVRQASRDTARAQAGGQTGSGEGRGVTLLATPFYERNAVLSPDGRWVAYEANSSGQYEVYVRPFPNVGDGQWQVSTGGGIQPVWARNGRELFYLEPAGALMAVPVEPRGTSWKAGTPTRVFAGSDLYAGVGFASRTYDVSPDGQRFLMIKQGGASDPGGPSPSIVVVQNWFEELRRIVPNS